MNSKLKILSTADLHINLKVNDDHYRSSLISTIQYIIAATHQYRPNWVFLSGDLFDKKVPTPAENVLLNTFITQLTGLAKVLIIQGNHDEPDNEEARHTLAPLKKLSIPNLYIFDEPGLYKTPDFDIIALPYIYHDRDACLRTLKEAHDTYTGDNLFFIGHCWVNEYMTETPAASEFAVPASFLSSLTKVKFGALGHIHLGGHVVNNFYYSGSPFRVTWGESEPTKSLLLYEDGLVNAIPTNTPPLMSIKFKEWDLSAPEYHNQMVYVHAEDIALTDLPRLESLVSQLRTNGNVVHVKKSFTQIDYSVVDPQKAAVTVSGYLDEYIANNDVADRGTDFKVFIDKILQGTITDNTSPFEIEELGLPK